MGEVTPLFNQNTYRKVKLSFKEAPKKFYRELLVSEDASLEEIGTAFAVALGSELEHDFYFRNKERSFVPDEWMDDIFSDKNIPFSEYSFNALGENFVFEYDSGECWEFTGKVYKKVETLQDDRICILLSGSGQGIWEDNAYPLRLMLSGELDPMCDEEDFDNGIEFPWNHDIEKFGDFFKDLTEEDIEELQSTIDFHMDSIFDENYEDYIEEMSEDNIMMATSEFVMSSLSYQIEHISFVHETFERLCKKYGEEQSFSKIFDVFMDHYLNVLSQDVPYSQDTYKKALKSIK